MVLSGFFRKSDPIAKTLAIRGEEFWPPVYEEAGLQMGDISCNAIQKPNRIRMICSSIPAEPVKIMPHPKMRLLGVWHVGNGQTKSDRS